MTRQEIIDEIYYNLSDGMNIPGMSREWTEYERDCIRCATNILSNEKAYAVYKGVFEIFEKKVKKWGDGVNNCFDK